MYGEPLEEVSSEKDLGVVFSSDMKVALHCRDSYSKACLLYTSDAADE